MRFVLAGASGFLGRAWASYLAAHDHDVVRLVRGETSRPGEARWDPYSGVLDRGLVESADVVANLAGAPLAHWPWTDAYKKTFLDSRVVTTRVLAEAIAASDRKPVFVAQNGIAGYGDRGSEVITEDTAFDGDTFIADVSRRWQAAADPAVDAGARVVVLRTGVVLDRSGGALKAMLPAFKAGVGGPIGKGTQYFATISLQDWLQAASGLAYDEQASGAYNLVGPDTSTNAEFTRELGKALHRPTFFRVPATPLRLAGGVAGGELLSSARVEPRRLLDQGYAFAHNGIADRVTAALEGFRTGPPSRR